MRDVPAIPYAGGISDDGDAEEEVRLFQKGAQKIIGFEFGASVTMDMKECFDSGKVRRITFKCIESRFFSQFDGEWKLEEDKETGETKISYVVLVRPKGPVPVMALEWRIREDVPTNLRSVKYASEKVNGNIRERRALSRESETVDDIGDEALAMAGVGSGDGKSRYIDSTGVKGVGSSGGVAAAVSAAKKRKQKLAAEKLAAEAVVPLLRGDDQSLSSSPVKRRVNSFVGRFKNPRKDSEISSAIDWCEDETMAAYLNENASGE